MNDDAVRRLLQEALDDRDFRAAEDRLESAATGTELPEEERRAWRHLTRALATLPQGPARGLPAGFAERLASAWEVESAEEVASEPVEPAVDPEPRRSGSAPAPKRYRSATAFAGLAAAGLAALGGVWWLAGTTQPATIAVAPVPTAVPERAVPDPVGTGSVAPRELAAPRPKLSALVADLRNHSWTLAEETRQDLREVTLLWGPAAGHEPADENSGEPLRPAGEAVRKAVESFWNRLPTLPFGDIGDAA